MLSVASLVTPVPPLWFQDATPTAAATAQLDGLTSDDPTAASPESWIVQFQTDVVASMTSVDQTTSLLVGLPAEYQVVRGLGQIGQVLIRTWGGSDDAIAAWYSADPVIASYQQDSIIHVDAVPNDPLFSSLSGLENAADADIDAAAAWDLTTGSSSIIVAVLDTGINYNHPDLAGNIWTNPGEIAGNGIDDDDNGFIDDVHGWDFANHDGDPMDDFGHGTHVAGTIGAIGNNGIGVVGVNWDVSLMALKFLDSTGNGFNSDAIAAINYATMMRERGNNVRVTNNSYGGGGVDPAMSDAIAASGDAGILFVAAAGNAHTNNDVSPFYPATYTLDNVISVAATDSNDALATFSNYGLTSVDLAAPGVNIRSTTFTGGYGLMSGTSMATPHVAGVAALASSLFPDATAQQIREAILAGVDPLASLAGKVATGGRLNAYNTLNYLLQHQTSTPPNYLATATPFEAIDLTAGAAGVTTVLDGQDDATATIDLGGNSFTFYGTTYTGSTSLYVSSNGLLTFGTPYDSAGNTNLATLELPAAIAPFWDDLRTDLDGSDKVLAKFDDVNGDSIPDRLIIEWSDVDHYPASASSVTFQAILRLNTGSSDGDIIFNYPDLDFGDAALNSGRSATVGVKDSGDLDQPRLLVAKDTGVSLLVGSNRAILLDRTSPTADIVDVSPDPRVSSVASVDVVFSEPIDATSFDFHDIALSLDGGANLVTSSVTVTQLTPTTWRINGLSGITSFIGSYSLSVDLAGITDLVGHHGFGTASDSWITTLSYPDIQVLSATADGRTTLSVNYQIVNSGVAPFDVGLYRSDDTTFGSDTLLGTVTISAPTDLSVGLHTKTWTIGTGVGQIPLPGAGSTEVDTDYFLLAVADPTDAIIETDVSSPGDNNVAVFSGVYHAPLGQVLVQGTAGADAVSASGTLNVTLNGQTYTYTSTDVTGVRTRTHGGDDTINASGFSKPVLSWGGNGNDTLTGGNGIDSLFGGAGNDVLAGGAGNDTLNGGADDDRYVFDTDTTLGSDTLTESDGGIDTLDFSTTSGFNVAVNLGLATLQTVNANLKLILGSTATFENVTGGSLNDTLTGNSLNNVLTGGTGNDTYVFDTDAALGSDTVSEAAAGGTDLLNFSTTTTVAVSIDLSNAAPQIINGNLTLTLSGGNVVENATGGSLSDTIVGNGLGNVLTGGAGNDTLSGVGGDDTLVGGAGNDMYLFDTDTPQGSDSLNESGGGIDTLDFSSTTSLNVAVDLSSPVAQVVNANLTLNLGSSTTIENVTGGSGNDLLVGNGLANALSGGVGNDSLTGGAGNDTLTGGQGNDAYLFDTDTALGSDILNESDGGIDKLDFSATGGFNVAVNLGLAAAQTVNVNLRLTLGSATTIENVVGGALNDTLTGNSLNNILKGGTGDDTYVFDADSALGTDSVIETAASGIDRLNFSATTTLGVNVDLSSTSPQAVNGNLTLTLSGGDVIENLTGGWLNDVLTGNTLSNVLTGGRGNDTYVFDADTPLGSDTLDESGGGIDTLDFSSTTSMDVAVDLSNMSTQIVNPNLTLNLGSSTTFEKLTGGAGNDVLIGNGLANVLSGGAGNDSLTGGAGNDTLNGGQDNDTYLFDTDTALGSDTLNESGGGIDKLDFSPTSGFNVAVNLGLATTQIVNVNLKLTLGSATTIEDVIGGSLNDTLTGNSLNNVLTGGTGDDAYVFDADSALGSDTIVEAADSGTDLLNFSATTTVGVNVNLSSTVPQAVNGNLTLMLSAGDVFEFIVGTALADTLTGNMANNLLVGGAGNDTLGGSGGRDVLMGGTGADTLTGGADDDILISGTNSYFVESTKVLNRPAIDAIMAEWTRTDADYDTRISHLRIGGGLNGTTFLTSGTVLSDGAAIDSLFGELGLDWFWQFGGDTIGDLGIGGLETVN